MKKDKYSEKIAEINKELDELAMLLEHRTKVEKEAERLISECRFEEAQKLLDTI